MEPPEILEYKKVKLVSLGFLGGGVEMWIPYFPWDGPPLPRFFPPWPWRKGAVETWGKRVLKYMAADVLPFSIPEVDVYVLSRKMVGKYRGNLRNVGEVALSSGDITQTVDILRRRIMDQLHSGTPPVPPRADTVVDFTFIISGAWTVIKELWDYLWNRRIEVSWVADLHLPGYAEEVFDVAPLDERYSGAARIDVGELNWHAWGAPEEEPYVVSGYYEYLGKINSARTPQELSYVTSEFASAYQRGELTSEEYGNLAAAARERRVEVS